MNMMNRILQVNVWGRRSIAFLLCAVAVFFLSRIPPSKKPVNPVARSIPQFQYFLKNPVTFGTITIPANTEVHVLRQTDAVYHVSANGLEFDVPADQVTSVRGLEPTPAPAH